MHPRSGDVTFESNDNGTTAAHSRKRAAKLGAVIASPEATATVGSVMRPKDCAPQGWTVIQQR